MNFQTSIFIYNTETNVRIPVSEGKKGRGRGYKPGLKLRFVESGIHSLILKSSHYSPLSSSAVVFKSQKITWQRSCKQGKDPEITSCLQSSEQVSQEEFVPRGGTAPLLTSVSTSAHRVVPRSAHKQPSVDPSAIPSPPHCSEKTWESGASVEESREH